MRREPLIGVALALALELVTSLFFLLRAPKPTRAAAQKPAATQARTEPPRRPRTDRPRRPAPAVQPAAVTQPARSAQSARARQLETTVLQAAVRHDWVVVDDRETPCPPQDVRIVYDAPADLGGYQQGAYFEPLGPGQGDSDVEVNGLML